MFLESHFLPTGQSAFSGLHSPCGGSYTDAIFLFVHLAFKPDVQGVQVSPNEIQEVPYAHPTLFLESNIAVGIDALFQRSQNSLLWHVVEQVLNIHREAQNKYNE
ncbi:hypothetical protein HPB47_028238 [Ixodes persulcatus]|uniref:Uncharacterized protein n=1 Tax=Ixodes persulcatus TaxID=34615 RepID=A0AC60PV77_IXOPE|nr:hypothetical protein HPB47_028238 [Ixodes persulcatus]